ncbi:hypothetical protein BD626DRAFT_392956 [Schizophyllum amplum]|uniref:Transcriptional adapter 2 n=1 Tax=Schizophyllum amplum TaxID=97359 RepID=A0A550CZP2_9AGAR|nr:hypothetical protein BD626DRAFT_392956 [Auriculariopsis ampla]
MTVSQRKQAQIEEVQTVSEPGDQIHCDACGCDLTRSIRFKCSAPECQTEEGIDICPPCFCSGKEFANHKRTHPYRVIEFHSYPIFEEDWGADEELMLIKGISLYGFGNWKRISEHVGTRSKEEVEDHYNKTYIESKDWPMPRMDVTFDIDSAEFQDRKRRRIAKMSAPPPPPIAPTSAPGVHEVQGFLPGRLEFEHEIDNEAEDLVKDLEFGVVHMYGGDNMPEDENDQDVRARVRWEEEKQKGRTGPPAGSKTAKAPRGFPGKKTPAARGMGKNGVVPNGHAHVKQEDDGAGEDEGEEEGDEATYPPPTETEDSLKLKLTMLEMYSQRVQKRVEAKQLMFDRGLLDYKKMQANDKKRPREERDILQRLRPFARLQTAEDFEVFSADILYEALLRKRIQDLQNYRRLGLTTAADIERYDIDLAKRAANAKAATTHSYYARPRATPADSESTTAAKRPAPLNLANSPALHLLTPAEQTLCSQLRILPRPYLVIKETLVREYARRGGKLRRREARDLVKIDVNKTSRVWDFLVQAGYLNITSDNLQGKEAGGAPPSGTPGVGNGGTPVGGGSSGLAGGSGSTPPKPPIPAAPAS